MDRNTLGRPNSSSDRDKRFLAAVQREEAVYVTALIHNNHNEMPTIRMDVMEEQGEAPSLSMAAPGQWHRWQAIVTSPGARRTGGWSWLRCDT